MNTAGLWIDHREAVVVALREEEVVAITRIASHAEKDDRHTVAPDGAQDLTSGHPFKERRMHQFDRFFDDIVDYIRSAQRIFIMGPDEGKREFARHLQQIYTLKGRIAGVETRDKMTDNQIVAAVEEFFAHPVRG